MVRSRQRARADLAARLAAVELVALDVDGVLTDGSIHYLGERELVRFDVHDGQAIAWLLRAGVDVAWISGRGCAATRARAKELGVRELHLRQSNKEATLAKLQARRRRSVEQTLAMGDDLVDLALARRAGVFCAPANARPEIRERAEIVTAARGGAGAVREVAELVLKAKGLWPALVARV